MSPVCVPRSIEELWDILDRDSNPSLYAGGTDVLVQRRQEVRPGGLVWLGRLRELRGIQDRGDAVFIGACTTHAQILNDRCLGHHFPLLQQAVAVLGSPPIRNMGTIGGNICTASPAGDALPALYALDAELELRRRTSVRCVPLREFIQGPGVVDLAAGEVLWGVRVRKFPAFNVHHFEKLGQRKALAIAVASLAALLRVSDSGVVEAVRLAWGSVGPTVITSRAVEEALLGSRLDDRVLREASDLAREAVHPITDVRATADFRRAVAGSLLCRLALCGSHADAFGQEREGGAKG